MIYLPEELRLRAAVFVCGLGFPALIGLALSQETNPGAESRWCSEARVEAPDQGYQVGLPDGWKLESLGAITEVRKDARTLAFVYRARAGDPAPPRLAAERVHQLAGALGTELALDGSRLHGSSGGIPVEGEVFVEVHGRDLVLAGGWAPASQWRGLQGRVEEVGRCYRRSRDTSG